MLTEAQAKKFERFITQQPGVDSVTTYVGTGSPRFYLPLDQIFPQSNVAQLVLLPKDAATRDALRLSDRQRLADGAAGGQADDVRAFDLKAVH